MNKFRQFMYGRYGTDHLNMALMILAIVLDILSVILKQQWIMLLAAATMILVIFRTLSRNLSKRSAENQGFLKLWNKLKGKSGAIKAEKADKDHKYYSCPKCGQRVRVPVGKGKIKITCPKCSNAFIKKS